MESNVVFLGYLFELILQVPNRFVDIEVVSRGDA